MGGKAWPAPAGYGGGWTLKEAWLKGTACGSCMGAVAVLTPRKGSAMGGLIPPYAAAGPPGKAARVSAVIRSRWAMRASGGKLLSSSGRSERKRDENFCMSARSSAGMFSRSMSETFFSSAGFGAVGRGGGFFFISLRRRQENYYNTGHGREILIPKNTSNH